MFCWLTGGVDDGGDGRHEGRETSSTGGSDRTWFQQRRSSSPEPTPALPDSTGTIFTNILTKVLVHKLKNTILKAKPRIKIVSDLFRLGSDINPQYLPETHVILLVQPLFENCYLI